MEREETNVYVDVNGTVGKVFIGQMDVSNIVSSVETIVSGKEGAVVKLTFPMYSVRINATPNK